MRVALLKSIRMALLPVFLLASLSACAGSEPYVKIKGQKIYVEIARTTREQALGLMYRTELAENRGMLFIYDQPQYPMAFWMKNTRIPLDILYFDPQLRLINISANTPPCRTRQCPAYPSHGPSQYVLEINAGLSERWQIRPGDVLELYLD